MLVKWICFKTIFARVPPLASADRCGAHPLHYASDTGIHLPLRGGQRLEEFFFCFTIVPSLREKVDLKFDIGAVFHRAMVASAPGEKLLIGRRPVRN